MINDKGIHASLAAGVVLAAGTIVAYSPPMLAVWALWAGATGWAIYEARRKHGHA